MQNNNFGQPLMMSAVMMLLGVSLLFNDKLEISSGLTYYFGEYHVLFGMTAFAYGAMILYSVVKRKK